MPIAIHISHFSHFFGLIQIEKSWTRLDLVSHQQSPSLATSKTRHATFNVSFCSC
jgi:hypothetical protein